MQEMAHDLALMWPEIVLLLTAVASLVCEMLRRPRAGFVVVLAGLLLASVLSVPLLGHDSSVFDGTYRVNALSVWAKLVLLPATLLAALLARGELAASPREGTVYSLLCFSTFGALILAGSGDTMLLVLGLLLSGLAGFALVAWPRDARATEAAMKFLIYASVCGAVMIFGLSYWFGITGTTLLGALGGLQQAPYAAALGLVGVLVGLGYKASLVPFHFWAPDAYEGAPVSVAAYLSVVPKIGALFALAQVVTELPESSGWQGILALVAAVTMTVAYLAALVQENVVRLLAYSSVAQAGYFLLAVIALTASTLALPALVVFAAAYSAMNLGAFAIVTQAGTSREELRGLGRRRLWTGVAMSTFLFSLTGIPPLAGFAAKFLLFGASIEAGYLWLAVIGIINSVLSLAVYLRIIVPMYRPVGEAGGSTPTGGKFATIVWLVGFLATLLIGVLAQGILQQLQY